MSIEQVGKFNFAAEEQQDRGIDRFSKGLAQALLRANEMCKKAHMELLSRRLNRGQFREVAIAYNQAAREYNQQRQRLIGLGTEIGETRKLYGIEEKLRTAAAQLQSITDTLKASPRLAQRDDKENKKRITYEKQPINWSRVGLLGTIGLSMVILPSCAAAEIVQIENQKPTDPTEESVPTVESETNPGSLINPTPSPEVVPSPTTDPLKVNLDIPSDFSPEEIANLQEGTQQFTLAFEKSINKNPEIKEKIFTEDGPIVNFDPNNLFIKDGVEAYFTVRGEGVLDSNMLLLGKDSDLRFHSFKGLNAILGTNFSEETHKMTYGLEQETKEEVGLVENRTTGEIDALTDLNGQWSFTKDAGYTAEQLKNIQESSKKEERSAVELSRESYIDPAEWAGMTNEEQMQFATTALEKMGVNVESENITVVTFHPEEGVIRTEDGRIIECPYDINEYWEKIASGELKTEKVETRTTTGKNGRGEIAIETAYLPIVWEVNSKMLTHEEIGLETIYEGYVDEEPKSAIAYVVIPFKNQDFGFLKKIYVDLAPKFKSHRGLLEEGSSYSGREQTSLDAIYVFPDGKTVDLSWLENIKELKIDMGIDEVMLLQVALENNEKTFYRTGIDGKEPYTEKEKLTINNAVSNFSKPVGEAYVVSNIEELTFLKTNFENTEKPVFIPAIATVGKYR